MVIDGEEPQLSRILKECRGARERAKLILNWNGIELYFEKLKIVGTKVKDL